MSSLRHVRNFNVTLKTKPRTDTTSPRVVMQFPESVSYMEMEPELALSIGRDMVRLAKQSGARGKNRRAWEDGRAAYLAYRKLRGGFSVKGETLPVWENLASGVQNAWMAAAHAVLVCENVMSMEEADAETQLKDKTKEPEGEAEVPPASPAES